MDSVRCCDEFLLLDVESQDSSTVNRRWAPANQKFLFPASHHGHFFLDQILQFV